jgi:hypothetical protein
LVLEVVEEKKERERSGTARDGGSGKGDGTLNIQLSKTELAQLGWWGG